MTNKEVNLVNCEPASDPRIAALLAVHLVSQILDEAYLVADAALESGQPWRYLSMLKNNINDTLCEPSDQNMSFVASGGDSVDVNENKIEHDANVVATSTPQKVAGDDFEIDKPESSLIGQGDEDFETDQVDLTKSNSMILNNLFDMSEVEKVVLNNHTKLIQSMTNQSNPESNALTGQDMEKIMESYVNTAMAMAVEPTEPVRDSLRTGEYDYSFVADAYAADTAKDMAFYLHDDDIDIITSSGDASHLVPNVKITELQGEENSQDIMDKGDVEKYENAYLTLNRDYDQCSEDDGYPILQDPKGMTLQEVALLTANTSEENITNDQEPEKQEDEEEKKKEFAAISAVSAATGSKRSSLVVRCRSQGARLLACLRGWWRRRTPGKRKEHRIPMAVHGLCPLSPDARRRAASLLDQRLLRSPSPDRRAVWKFNTVNETVVNSTHWKEYTFDSTPGNCGEY